MNRRTLLATLGAVPIGSFVAQIPRTCQYMYQRSVDIVVNPKTAKALGLAIPPSLLSRAARVIE